MRGLYSQNCIRILGYCVYPNFKMYTLETRCPISYNVWFLNSSNVGVPPPCWTILAPTALSIGWQKQSQLLPTWDWRLTPSIQTDAKTTQPCLAGYQSLQPRGLRVICIYYSNTIWCEIVNWKKSTILVFIIIRFDRNRMK